jgi:cytochrome c biogenesis protein CcmG/thiol:disulfide interchange protein DsbE
MRPDIMKEIPMAPRLLPMLAALLTLGAVLTTPALALDKSMNGKPYDARQLMPAPDFSFPTAQGDEQLALSDFKGNVRLVVFWATWCPSCRLEVPDLVALQAKYAKKGLTVLSLSKEEPKTIQAFAEANGINYHTLVSDRSVYEEYGGIRSIPTTFVVGRKGNIYKHYVGKPPLERLEADIKALL